MDSCTWWCATPIENTELLHTFNSFDCHSKIHGSARSPLLITNAPTHSSQASTHAHTPAHAPGVNAAARRCARGESGGLGGVARRSLGTSGTGVAVTAAVVTSVVLVVVVAALITATALVTALLAPSATVVLHAT
jgi:hypothetical protein